jgi:long-subunit acyl-CoA synthetase (AMP-forming)
MEGALRTPAADGVPSQPLVPATMCEAFQLTAAANAERIALRSLGDAVSITFAEYADQVKQLAAGLHALGVGRGDTVGFMLTNRPEFHLLDSAAMHLGATPFSIYNTSSADQIAYLLADAGNRIMIVEAAFLDRALAAMSETGTVKHLIVIDGDHDGALSIDELERLGAQAQEFDFDAAWRAVKPDDVLTLIYTSGTTGPPKGVMLTHANEIAQCRGSTRPGARRRADRSSRRSRTPISPTAASATTVRCTGATPSPAARTSRSCSPTSPRRIRRSSAASRGSGRS